MSAIDKIRGALRIALPTLAPSSGSIEQKIIEVVGTYADSEALERQNTLNVINEALANQKITGIAYYRRKAIEYQEDSEVLFDSVNQGAYYANLDPTKQIIKQACIVGEFPDYALRVNKLGNDGHLTQLTESECLGFKSYFANFQPLGMPIVVQSLPVAEISDPGLIVYIRPGYDATATANAINQAFIDFESVLRTTNTVSVSELSDIIQSVEGVKAVSFSGQLAAIDTGVSGTRQTIRAEQGLFHLTTNAFTFKTAVGPSMVKILQ